MSEWTHKTPEQWQAAVDVSHALLFMESLRQYRRPRCDLDRAEELLRRGAELGVKPSSTAVEDFVGEWNDSATQRR